MPERIMLNVMINTAPVPDAQYELESIRSAVEAHLLTFFGAYEPVVVIAKSE